MPKPLLRGKKFIVTFSKVPHSLLEDKEISPSAKLVYAGFARWADNKTGLTWAGRQKVADMLGLSLRTVKVALTTLNEKGWIVTKPQGRGKTAFRYVRYTRATGKARKTVQKSGRLDGANIAPQNQTQSTITTQQGLAPSGEASKIVKFRTHAA